MAFKEDFNALKACMDIGYQTVTAINSLIISHILEIKLKTAGIVCKPGSSSLILKLYLVNGEIQNIIVNELNALETNSDNS